MEKLSCALFGAQGADSEVRSESLQTLMSLARMNPEQYLMGLSLEMASESVPSAVRQLSGILIKNLLNNSLNDPQFLQVWGFIGSCTKEQIRNNTLSCLASADKDVKLVACQTVACIACFDLPVGHWPEVLKILIKNSTHLNFTYKLAAIRTLGYICEGLDIENLSKSESDSILTALVSGLEQDNQTEVRICALNAIKNSLKFFKNNFTNNEERKILIQVLLASLQDAIIEVKKEALMVFCEIVSLYYTEIELEIEELTKEMCIIIDKDSELVSIYALEFFNLFVDEEIQRIEFQKPCYQFSFNVANILVPIILQKVHLFDAEPEEWNLQKACISVLNSIAIRVGDYILKLVGGFLTNFPDSKDLEVKSSGVLVIGSIVEGLVDANTLLEFTLDDIIRLTYDPIFSVRVNAAWAMSKICEHQLDSLAKRQHLNNVINCLIRLLNDLPEASCHACYAISHIFSDKSKVLEMESVKVHFVFKALIDTALKQQNFGNGHDMITSVFSAIHSIVENADEKCFGFICLASPIILNLLEDSIKEHLILKQSLACFVLHTIFARAKHGTIESDFADRFVETILNLFTSQQSILEEGLQALGSLAENLQTGFLKYFAKVMPFVGWSIAQETPSLCRVGVMTLGDFSRGLGFYIDNYIDPIIPNLLTILSQPSILIDVKIRTIETLGDLASNNFSVFSKFFKETLKLIESAGKLSMDLNLIKNPDMDEYLPDLRESILSFYTEAFQGCVQHKHPMIEFTSKAAEYCLTIIDPKYNPSLDIYKSAIGLLGDLFNFFPESIFKKAKVIQQYLADLSCNSTLQDSIEYTNTSIQNCKLLSS